VVRQHGDPVGCGQNVEEAHEFLNYIMKPEVMAKASNYVYYANGNAASKEFLEEAVIGDPAIYPMR
jgi:putrescine transport system substrate-binding protein